jgi:deferrochelatase/peroxidase EfeB
LFRTRARCFSSCEYATNSKAVAKIAAGGPALTAKVGVVEPRAKLVCTVSFGSQFWHVISPQFEKMGNRSVARTRKAVGRRKKDSKELSDKLKPPTAHISRVVMEENGKELEIVRHSFPYGTVSESGVFFIAYTKNLNIPERMLSRRYGTAGDGLHDHLMGFTRAVTGATFFAPSLPVLKSLGASS